MAGVSNITIDYLLEALTYYPETGIFIWNYRPIHHFKNKRAHSSWNARYARKAAGKISKNGYHVISINNKNYYSHRLAYMYINGDLNNVIIDHINMNKLDNRIQNLRVSDINGNNRNVTKKGIRVLLKGVYKKDGKYFSSICFNGNQRYLGKFDCPAAASFAYQIAADINFGEFARPF